MTREEAISNINSLYPVDSDYKDTAEVGRKLLNQAKKDTGFDWRDLPDRTLIRYAELCIHRDNFMTNEIFKRKTIL